MSISLRALALTSLVTLVPASALAEDWEEDYPPSGGPATPYPQAPSEGTGDQPLAEAPPDGAVPPPPAAEQGRSASVPEGQWVRTTQYGWVWMPYADAFTYVPVDGVGAPYMFVWRPAYGWRWLVAPWVWGYGPWPYFGIGGSIHFAWYGHGWWRTPHRWHWAHRPFHGGWSHGGWGRGGWGHGTWGHGGRTWRDDGPRPPARWGAGFAARPAPRFRSGGPRLDGGHAGFSHRGGLDGGGRGGAFGHGSGRGVFGRGHRR